MSQLLPPLKKPYRASSPYNVARMQQALIDHFPEKYTRIVSDTIAGVWLIHGGIDLHPRATTIYVGATTSGLTGILQDPVLQRINQQQNTRKYKPFHPLGIELIMIGVPGLPLSDLSAEQNHHLALKVALINNLHRAVFKRSNGGLYQLQEPIDLDHPNEMKPYVKLDPPIDPQRAYLQLLATGWEPPAPPHLERTPVQKPEPEPKETIV